MAYSDQAGFGVEGAMPALEPHSAGKTPFFFSVDVPEGNYKVTVTFGGDAASDTTVKAELRRLMLERVVVGAGRSATRTFIINVRTPAYPGGAVKLKPREIAQEARAWDSRLSLEFDGTPAVRALKIEPADVPTIYVLGDSTVADQPGEPYASWGQMLPRFFKPSVAVANHAESGESTFSAIIANRFEKIAARIRPGDYFLVQFGHNDQKSKDPDAEQKFKANLVAWVQRVKAAGATPVIVTPMFRNRFDGDQAVDTAGPFPRLAREAAQESGALLIDLHARSKVLYEAMGPRSVDALFMHNADFSVKDGSHHGPYGAYELAKIVVQGLRDAKTPIARAIVDDLPPYDPRKPMPESEFKVPPSIVAAEERPLGVNQP
ncbi:MAG TPA: rhamnogalacturonan acetylesterase [Caulobacter sp.]|nr:rhamnogalacturonan acetylesterase [Caulobacter sp.]